LLDRDGAEYDRLLDTLTINVTKLFRNWTVYEAMGERVIPAIWQSNAPRVRVWSAGCSSGEEPYSLAVLFHRHALAKGMLDHLERVDVLGTDIDRASLDRAERGEFQEGDFSETPDDLRARYFAPTAPFAVAPSVRALVRFERRDLLEEGPPPSGEGAESGFHLITCRH